MEIGTICTLFYVDIPKRNSPETNKRQGGQYQVIYISNFFFLSHFVYLSIHPSHPSRGKQFVQKSEVVKENRKVKKVHIKQCYWSRQRGPLSRDKKDINLFRTLWQTKWLTNQPTDQPSDKRTWRLIRKKR